MSSIETRIVLKSETSIDKSLENCTFIIKDYQRGYRWEEQQVKELLQDLYDFNHDNHTTKYCMQPLVVKKIQEEEYENSGELARIISNEEKKANEDTYKYCWELIDGQQRLTTTLLILNSCYENLRKVPPMPYRICYSQVRNIDEYYIRKAKDTIDIWFEQFGNRSDDVRDDIRKKINNDIQFIWYEVDSHANSVDIFTKLNVGKIPLTNAELFKSQLLNPDISSGGTTKEETDKHILLAQIAFEWDKIEQSLRDDELWSFISNESRDAETRIDYLLRLYALQLKNGDKIDQSYYEGDKLFPFLAINNYMRENPSVKNSDIWKEIVDIHDKLKSWSEDLLLYHYIGFLITIDKSGLKVIIDLIRSTSGKRKSEVKDFVISMIKKQMKNIKLSELSYQKDGNKIRKVLLFFNIYTMVQSKTESKFSFKQYKSPNMKWDIEHIHARATDEEIRAIKVPEKRKEFLLALKEQFIEIRDIETADEIDKFIENKVLTKLINEDEFLEFCCKVTEKYGEFDENGIGNLTLLDSATNRAYHNALYPIKRNKIIERDKGEVFIPVCTKNVFLKMYSEKLINPMEWTKDDADDYFNAIKKALVEEAEICQ